MAILDYDSVPPSLDEVAQDGFLAEGSAGFQSVQSLDEHEALAVLPNENGRVLP